MSLAEKYRERGLQCFLISDGISNPETKLAKLEMFRAGCGWRSMSERTGTPGSIPRTQSSPWYWPILTLPLAPVGGNKALHGSVFWASAPAGYRVDHLRRP